ncbi:MAG: IS630 family transposase, partial [bacterium]
ELKILSTQCLNRRIPDKQTFEREVNQWQNQRNFLKSKVDWRFSSDDARIKLKRLYPTLFS